MEDYVIASNQFFQERPSPMQPLVFLPLPIYSKAKGRERKWCILEAGTIPINSNKTEADRQWSCLLICRKSSASYCNKSLLHKNKMTGVERNARVSLSEQTRQHMRVSRGIYCNSIAVLQKYWSIYWPILVFAA